jgi:hypothetical protein
MMRPNFLKGEDHDLVTRPLDCPTGPGGATGFENRAGSQIAVPEVTNVYLGTFWGDRGFVDGFGKALVETATSIRSSNFCYHQSPSCPPVLLKAINSFCFLTVYSAGD